MQVTNTEFLRGYKVLKEKLTRGEVDEITIP